MVQESVAERYDVKKSVFRQIDRAAEPEAILASSSSGLLISELQTVMERPGRSLIAHPFNPPHLIPLVELVPGNGSTSGSQVSRLARRSRAVPAFLLARLPKTVFYTEVLQRIRHLLRRSDYYRLERPLPGGNRTR